MNSELHKAPLKQLGFLQLKLVVDEATHPILEQYELGRHTIKFDWSAQSASVGNIQSLLPDFLT